MGFPRESRISRAQIFSIDMMAEISGGRKGRKIRGLKRWSLISGRDQRLGGMGKRLLQWVGGGEELAAVLPLEGIPPTPWGEKVNAVRKGRSLQWGEGEDQTVRREDTAVRREGPWERFPCPLSSSSSPLVGFPQISECNGCQACISPWNQEEDGLSG